MVYEAHHSYSTGSSGADARTGRVPRTVPRPFPRGARAASALERYLTGLLTEHPNKNCDTIAQVVPGTSEQRLQGLLTDIDLGRGRPQPPAGPAACSACPPRATAS